MKLQIGKWALAAGVIALLATSSHPAEATANKKLTYRYDSIWSTAIRMIRVNKGYKITDKDRENGYLLFVFIGSGAVKNCAASLEIIKVINDGYIHHKLKLNIAHQPSYIEVHFLDRLEQKLRQELGAPPPAKREKKEPEPPKKDPPAKKK